MANKKIKSKKMKAKKTVIKRVARNKKKVTTKQKILAGLGLGGALIGGASAGSNQSKPVYPIVSTKDKSEDGLAKKAENLISRYFTIPKAKADLENQDESWNWYLDQIGWEENFGGGGGALTQGTQDVLNQMSGVYNVPSWNDQNSGLGSVTGNNFGSNGQPGNDNDPGSFGGGAGGNNGGNQQVGGSGSGNNGSNLGQNNFGFNGVGNSQYEILFGGQQGGQNNNGSNGSGANGNNGSQEGANLNYDDDAFNDGLNGPTPGSGNDSPPDIGNQNTNTGLSAGTQNVLNQIGSVNTGYTPQTSSQWQQELQYATNSGAQVSSDGSIISYVGPDGELHSLTFEEFNNGSQLGALGDQSALPSLTSNPSDLGSITGDGFNSDGTPKVGGADNQNNNGNQNADPVNQNVEAILTGDSELPPGLAADPGSANPAVAEAAARERWATEHNVNIEYNTVTGNWDVTPKSVDAGPQQSISLNDAQLAQYMSSSNTQAPPQVNGVALTATGDGRFTDSGGQNIYAQQADGSLLWFNPQTGSYTSVNNMPEYALPANPGQGNDVSASMGWPQTSPDGNTIEWDLKTGLGVDTSGNVWTVDGNNNLVSSGDDSVSSDAVTLSPNGGSVQNPPADSSVGSRGLGSTLGTAANNPPSENSGAVDLTSQGYNELGMGYYSKDGNIYQVGEDGSLKQVSGSQNQESPPPPANNQVVQAADPTQITSLASQGYTSLGQGLFSKDGVVYQQDSAGNLRLLNTDSAPPAGNPAATNGSQQQTVQVNLPGTGVVNAVVNADGTATVQNNGQVIQMDANTLQALLVANSQNLGQVVNTANSPISGTLNNNISNTVVVDNYVFVTNNGGRTFTSADGKYTYDSASGTWSGSDPSVLSSLATKATAALNAVGNAQTALANKAANFVSDLFNGNPKAFSLDDDTQVVQVGKSNLYLGSDNQLYIEQKDKDGNYWYYQTGITENRLMGGLNTTVQAPPGYRAVGDGTLFVGSDGMLYQAGSAGSLASTNIPYNVESGKIGGAPGASTANTVLNIVSDPTGSLFRWATKKAK